MKMLLLSAAALGAVALAPALAQSVQTPHSGHHLAQPMTRTAVVQKVQEHFARLDSNRDGFVTKAEMETAKANWRENAPERAEKRQSKRFDRLDSNDDGSISRSEFDSAHGKSADHKRMMRHGGFAGHMFEMADANKDGRVSLQEATTAAAAHFDGADANHDGTLTREEMRAAHKAMRATTGRR